MRPAIAKKLCAPGLDRIGIELMTNLNVYADMVFTKLKNLKLLVLDAYRTKNKLQKEQKDILSTVGKLTEERKIVICRADKDGKFLLTKILTL